MKRLTRVFPFSLLLFLLLLSSCATTELSAVWRDESFHGRIQKTVVVGAFRSAAIRNLFEDEFVRMLGGRGVNAVASYTIVPIEELKNRDEVMKRIRETGADSALMTRLVDRRTQRTYVPGEAYFVPGYYYYWGPYFDYIYTPGYILEEEIAYAETNIYELSEQRLIWSARSRTLLSGNDRELIRSFAETMVEEMERDGLIGGRQGGR